jgi:uncharacterized membrane protein YoaK (UPF0700 family)
LADTIYGSEEEKQLHPCQKCLHKHSYTLSILPGFVTGIILLLLKSFSDASQVDQWYIPMYLIFGFIYTGIHYSFRGVKEKEWTFCFYSIISFMSAPVISCVTLFLHFYPQYIVLPVSIAIIALVYIMTMIIENICCEKDNDEKKARRMF